MQEENVQEARDYAFLLLSYRERSIAEIRERLSRKDYSKPVIEQVVKRLCELDFLNDRRFAEKWILSRIKYKPRGRFLLTRELQQKGVKQKTIQTVLDKLYDRNEELNAGKQLADKWLRTHSQEDSTSPKLKKYLNRKGFSFDLITEIVSFLSR